MCGIFGVLKKTSSYDILYESDIKRLLTIFSSLAKESMARGRDSTGAIIIQRPEVNHFCSSDTGETKMRYTNGCIFTLKSPLPANEFLEDPKFMQWKGKVNEHTRALLGHTRAATSASPLLNENNHPHICGTVVGIHNGCIHNWYPLSVKYNIKMRGTCDSELLFALIDKLAQAMTIEEAIKKAASLVEGSFACALVSTLEPHKVFLFRRAAPLILKYRNYTNIVMFASEARFIHTAFRAAEFEKQHSPHFIDLSEYIIPDNHGIAINLVPKPASGWLDQVLPFELKA